MDPYNPYGQPPVPGYPPQQQGYPPQNQGFPQQSPIPGYNNNQSQNGYGQPPVQSYQQTQQVDNRYMPGNHQYNQYQPPPTSIPGNIYNPNPYAQTQQQFEPQFQYPQYPQSQQPIGNVYQEWGYSHPYTLQPIQQSMGSKKALLIGINYFGTPNELKGCISDVHKMKQYLLTRGFTDTPTTMVVLTDDQQDPYKTPTRVNILNAFNWLIGGAKSGDSLFFQFSGHGSQVKDTSGDEEDGLDETILPIDWKTGGQIIDDEIHNFVVKPLPFGARLTAIMDCCHSGTGMDLPFIFGGSQVGNYEMALSNKGKKKSKELFSNAQSKGESVGDVILFSGCRDDQTSADVTTAMSSGGAMTTAFLKASAMNTNNPYLTYAQLLVALRDCLKTYSQVAQLSTGRPMDMNQPFTL